MSIWTSIGIKTETKDKIDKLKLKCRQSVNTLIDQIVTKALEEQNAKEQQVEVVTNPTNTASASASVSPLDAELK